MQKSDLLQKTVEHIDFKTLEAVPMIDAMRKMSFTSRAIAEAADIYERMLRDPDCTIILTLAGSTSAAGLMNLYADLVRLNMVDAIVATGASIVDMDFFEALGFKHYIGTPDIDDHFLRSLYIDRIYDTFIDEEQLQECDNAVKTIADSLEPRPFTSREFIAEMGKWLVQNSKKPNSLVQTAYECGVPIFCPAFSDSSAGFGLVKHQWERPEKHLTLDSAGDFLELTRIKMDAPTSGLLMVGGGVPKNFAQDTVVCAEVLGREVPMHQYAIQITVADVRDGACSSSTLKEASSWGKVETMYEKMVYAEATTVLPLMAANAYRKGAAEGRPARRWSRLYEK
jgi:deoxyhypusine synthase